MSSTTAPAAAPPAADERLAKTGVFARLMRRPEFGALIGAVAVFVLFTAVDQTGKFASLDGVARWTDSASTVGIVAVSNALSYLDFRWPQLPWRDTHPRLAAWQARIEKLASFEAHPYIESDLLVKKLAAAR